MNISDCLPKEISLYESMSGDVKRGPWRCISGTDARPKGYRSLKRGEMATEDCIAWITGMCVDGSTAWGRWITLKDWCYSGGPRLAGCRFGETFVCMKAHRVSKRIAREGAGV